MERGRPPFLIHLVFTSAAPPPSGVLNPVEEALGKMGRENGKSAVR